jgi:polyphosphate kinase
MTEVRKRRKAAAPSLTSPDRFLNRELSWLAFNTRVLEEAENPAHPLLERLRFLSISANNLDEFYMVRVAGLHEQVRAGIMTRSQDGATPAEQLARIQDAAQALMAKQQERWMALRAELRTQGLSVIDPDELTREERAELAPKFMQSVFPLLTPLAIDPAHPFPFIPNQGFAIALKLRRKEDQALINGLLPVPSQVPRFMEVSVKAGEDGAPAQRRFLSLENTLMLFLDQLFPGHDVEAKGAFRIIRDSDI